MVSETERRRGIELFNAGEFYECHEVLEDAWRPSGGAERYFLQALIHFAVGFYHHRQGNPVGAELQLRKGLRKLAGYLPVFREWIPGGFIVRARLRWRRFSAAGILCISRELDYTDGMEVHLPDTQESQLR